MSKILVVRIAGEEKFRCIDLDTGGIQEVAVDAIEKIADARQESAFSGVDAAMVLPPHPNITGRIHIRAA